MVCAMSIVPKHATTDPQQNLSECSEIQGLTVPDTVETTGVTSFVQDAAQCADTLVLPTVAFETPTEEAQDLKEYFRRPRVITTGSLEGVTVAINGVDLTIDKLLIWFPSFKERLAGVYGIRFTAVFTLMVSANPFHQGVVALSFQYDAAKGDYDQFCRATSPFSCTQLPHVRLDISENTMAQLKVPFLNYRDYLLLGSSIYCKRMGVMGFNQIIPTAPLANSGAPTYKLLLHLEDLELIGALPMTESTIAPQSGAVRQTKTPNFPSVVARESSTGGMLSSALTTGGSVLQGARGPPLLSKLAGSLGWAMRLAGGVASAFGYSKPRDATLPSRRYLTDYIGENNFDMPSSAFSLGATAENSIVHDNVFAASAVDEMSFKHILGIYSQLCQFSISTSDTTGTRLWGTAVVPNHWWYRYGVGKPFTNTAVRPNNNGVAVSNAFYPTGLFYWAQFFRQWRGGVKLRCTFGKTKFHAGRVIIGYVPHANIYSSGTPVIYPIPAVEVDAIAPQPFSYTAIWDLKDSNVFEFEVPYVSPFLWNGINSSTGGVTMTVLDPLIANGEVSSTINCLVEIAAADDFEFAVPRCPAITVAMDSTSEFIAITTQSGGPDPDPGIVFPDPPPVIEPQAGMPVANSKDTKEYTVGEAFTSVKQILMMPTQATWSATGVAKCNLPFFCYLPYVGLERTIASISSDTYWISNRAGLAATCFAFWQGSTSYDVYLPAGKKAGNNFYVRASYAPGDGGDNTSFSVSTYSNTYNDNGLKILTVGDALHFQAPAYSFNARNSWRNTWKTTGFSTRNFTPFGSMLINDNTFAVPNLAIVPSETGATYPVSVSLSGGDDAKVGCYIGPPPIRLYKGSDAGITGLYPGRGALLSMV
jgi:hypothetical protein